MNSNRWITFDCFGTLIDWHSGFSAILHPIFGDRISDLLREYHQFERQLEAERPHRLYKDVLASSLQRAAEELSITVDSSKVKALPESWDSLRPFHDVEPALAALRRAGFHLAVLTNCDDDLFAITQSAFTHPFDLVVTAEHVCDYKPSLAHFRFFSRVTGVEDGNWVHVACSWFHDIAPARDLGIKRVWLDRDQTGEDRTAATHCLRSATDLPDAVAELFEQSSN